MCLLQRVAPREGSVDRNLGICAVGMLAKASLPARGAWIEIIAKIEDDNATIVAPREGSVDRNMDLSER